MSVVQIAENVQTVLSGDSALTTALGGSGKVRRWFPNAFLTLPIVTWAVINHRIEGADYFDDAPESEVATIGVDAWTNGSNVLDVAAAVQNALVSRFWSLDFTSDVPEPDAKIRHVAMRFSRRFTPLDF